jgi:Tol biopolymer transport system component
MTGRVLAHYEMLEKLGEGGMGVVYRARDTRLERFAAVKVLPAARAGDGERRARFMQEARAASALNHPNIVTVYEVNSDGDVIYIAMELVDGKSLDQSIPLGGMKIKTALETAIPIADALAKAHAAGIVHRDLKPGNVMLSADGRVKLLDFGLAKLTEASGEDNATQTLATLTQQGTIVGTAAYMSPEQAEGKPVDPRSDIFSFGAVLYEMLSGQRAFPGSSMVSTLAAVLDKDPAPIGAAVPREVDRIVRRCLRKEPARRYQHAGDIKIALEDALADSETARTSATSPAAAAPRRLAGWLWPGVAAAAVLAAGASWWFRPVQPTLPDAPLQRITGDSGLTTNPAISPDGRLIAYASDRAGNGDLDIWVQHRGGGDPIRVTHDASDEFDPSFSADGSQIVYAAAGGIYLVPALGGEPRRLARAGRRPRLSPDGKRVVYGTEGGGGVSVFLVDIGNEQPRPVAPKLPVLGFPVWSPDGRYLLVSTYEGRGSLQKHGWWLVPVDTLEPVSLGGGNGPPQQWLAGDHILFQELRQGPANFPDAATDLWVAQISPAKRKLMGVPRRLTYGTALVEGASVAADGTMVLAAASYQTNLWSLPLDANTGKVRGPAEPLTREAAYTAYPSISMDGKKLAFQSDAEGPPKIWLMDVASRHKRKLTPLSGWDYRPEISRDGTKLAYHDITDSGKVSLMVADVTSFEQPGTPHEVCGEQCVIPWSWWGDNRGFLATMVGVQSIGYVAAAGGVVEYAKGRLFQAHPSPDGKWMVIMDGSMKIARLQDGKLPDHSQWKPTGEGGDLYRWSPDGNTIYFISSRDKFRCIWARRLDPATKDPVGEAFPVYHSHGARLSMQSLVDSGSVGLAVARDRVVFTQAERAGNIWMGKLDLK